jgi:hypothetical protein
MTNAHYTGRCSCGQVKYDITGEPVREARLADDSENRVAAKAGAANPIFPCYYSLRDALKVPRDFNSRPGT